MAGSRQYPAARGGVQSPMYLRPDESHQGGRREPVPEDRGRRPSTRRASISGRPERKSFLVRKDGHVFTFVYPPEHERAALEAMARCPKLDREDILALVCYLGHDPRDLGLALD